MISDDQDRAHVLELIRSVKSDAVPSLVSVHEDHELNFLHDALLRLLDRGDALAVKDVAELIGRSVSQTSRLLDHLVRRGLVERAVDDADRRVRRVGISAEGIALLRRIDRMRAEAHNELWSYLTEGERQTVLQALELYAKAAKRMRDERG
jgi:DNA-binding MarR family transcriptional regulator